MSTTVSPRGAGSFTVTLTVVDDLGARSSTPITVAVAAGAPADSGGGGGGAVGGIWLALLTVAAVLAYRHRPEARKV